MALPEPSFIDRDPATVTAENIALYESLSGKTLQPAQPEMLMVNQIAYRESLLRIGIQEAAKQCLVDYAIYPMIDYLGALVGVERLPAQYAVTTLRVTLSETLAVDLLIPSGSLVATKDGLYTFATASDLTIAAGSLTGTVMASAETAGTGANNYAIGTITDLLSPLSYIDSIINITATSGGVDEETDDQLRARIKLAPESFSVAGARNAYIYWAKTAHQSIIDVEVAVNNEGNIILYPLLATGTPSTEILTAVEAICSAEDVRPLSDTVTAQAPTRKTTVINVGLVIYDNADAATVKATAETALAKYAVWLRTKLGRDVICERITAVAGVDGVYRPTVISPAADIINEVYEWCDCTAITVTITGTVTG